MIVNVELNEYLYSMQNLPISEIDISQLTQMPVYSPILCASLDHFNIDTSAFISHFKDCFAQMSWDNYDVKRKQMDILNHHQISYDLSTFKEYYNNDTDAFTDFVESCKIVEKSFDLTGAILQQCQAITPWRRRSVCSFKLSLKETIQTERIYPKEFVQTLADDDMRSWPRVFDQTEKALVNNDLFHSFLKGIAQYAQQVTPHIRITEMTITAHFMSVKAKEGVPGNNSPEGAHEDGADFIVSALVINRQNIIGGESQVLEKLDDGSMVKIFERELQPGEFLFQADTGEEKHYGNDLWHYVTPFYVQTPGLESWRDIIGLDLIIH